MNTMTIENLRNERDISAWSLVNWFLPVSTDAPDETERPEPQYFAGARALRDAARRSDARV